MSDYNPGTLTGTVAQNTNTITIAGGDLNNVAVGMQIYLGSRTRKTICKDYKILIVTPVGTTGGTVTVEDVIDTAYTNVPCHFDRLGYNGSATSLVLGSVARILSYLTTYLGLGSNLDGASKLTILDKGTSAATGRRGWSILGRLWFAQDQVAIGGVECLAIRAVPDGASPVNAIVVRGDRGTVDLRAGETTLASAATVDLGAANDLKVIVTGNAPISSFGAVPNCIRIVLFTGALELAHNNTSLILAGGANITTAAGDMAIATSDASGNWRLRHFQRASGGATFPGAVRVGAGVGSVTMSPGTSTLTGYIEFRKADGSRLAYMGADANVVPLVLENGASLAISGGLVSSTGQFIIGASSSVGAYTKLSIRYDGGQAEYGCAWRPLANDTTSNYFMNAAGSAIGSITHTSSATSFNTSSDGRIKPVEHREPLDPGNVFDRLRPQRFMIDFGDGGTPSPGMGFIAQELADVVPEAVTVGDGDPDARPGDGAFRMWQVDPSKLVPLLVAEVQSLRSRLAALEAAQSG